MAIRDQQIITLSGGMTTDLARNVMPPDMASFLKNCIIDYNKAVGNGEGQARNIGVVTPPQSNYTNFDQLFLAGRNITIGTHYDRKVNNMYWFVWNSLGNHTIWLYNANTDTFTLVLLEPLLPFDPYYPINSVDLVLADTSTDIVNVQNVQRLLYWTAENTFPCKINVDTAIAGGYSALTFQDTDDQYFRAVKYPPKKRPEFTNTLTNPDPAYRLNFVANKQFQFTYRFYYDDGEPSTCTLVSTLCFSVNPKRNFIELVMSAGASLVNRIELIYRIGNTGSWYSYQTIDRSEILSNAAYLYNNVTNTFTYKFYNNLSVTALDQNQVNKLFNWHPLKAGAQEFTEGNLLTYGNILEGYSNLTPTQAQTPTVEVLYEQYLPLTLTLDITIYFTPLAATETIQVRKINGQTGANTLEYTTAPTHINGLDPNPYTFQVILENVNYGDQFYLTQDGLYTINSGSQVIGTFSNITQPNSCGTGDFEVVKTTNQLANGIISFENAVSNTCGTWNTSTSIGTVNNIGNSLYQLKQGGTYNFDFILYDEALRSTFVQVSPDRQITIESIQENSQYQKQTININWNGLVVPDWVKYVVVCRTKNLNINRSLAKGYITFQINDVQFLKEDFSVGVVGTDAIKNVQFTLTQLNLFNTNYLENTTTSYTFTEGDRLQLIRNGNGDYYDFATYDLLDFPLNTKKDVPTNYIIPYQPELSTLVSNAQVFIYTPNKQFETNLYYEITDLIATTGTVGNNQVSEATTTLSTFDTYPITWSSPYVDVSLWTPESAIFEHHSLYAASIVNKFTTADKIEVTIGTGEDIGRTNIVNADARQVWKPSLVRISYPYIPNTFINGLSTFDEDRNKLYFRQYGAIVQLFADQYNLFILQEDNHFRAVINKNLVTLADGTVQLTAGNVLLSDPIVVDGDWGCQNSSSFEEYNGQLFWQDLKRGAWCMSDWSKTIDISRNGLCKSYVESKLKFIYNWNIEHPTNFYMVNSGIDPKNKMYFSTYFLLDTESDEDGTYINNATDIELAANETFAYNIEGQVFSGFYAFTPEQYSFVDGQRKGISMVTFRKGIPFFHNLNDTTTYQTFYGTQTDQYIRIVVNKSPQTEKVWLTIGYDSKSKTSMISGIKYAGNDVSTSDYMTSVIPMDAFEFRENFYYATFYRNTSYGGTILNGQVLRGTWVEVGLLRDTDQKDVYNELSKIILNFETSEKAIT